MPQDLESMLAHPLLGPWIAAQKMKELKRQAANEKQDREWAIEDRKTKAEDRQLKQQNDERNYQMKSGETQRGNTNEDLGQLLTMMQMGATPSTPQTRQVDAALDQSGAIGQIAPQDRRPIVTGTSGSYNIPTVKERQANAAQLQGAADARKARELDQAEQIKAKYRPAKEEPIHYDSETDDNGNRTVAAYRGGQQISTTSNPGVGKTRAASAEARPTAEAIKAEARIAARTELQQSGVAGTTPKADMSLKNAFETAKANGDDDGMRTKAEELQSRGWNVTTQEDPQSPGKPWFSVTPPAVGEVDEKDPAFQALVDKHYQRIEQGYREGRTQGAGQVTAAPKKTYTEADASKSEQAYLKALAAGQIPPKTQIQMEAKFKEQYGRSIKRPVSGAQ